MIRVLEVDGIVRESWDDTAYTVTYYDAAGVLVDSTPENPNPRSYTAAEIAFADALAQDRLEEANARTIEQALTGDLTAMQTLIDTTNATINAGPAPFLKDIARAIRRLDRRALEDYSGTT